jgi:hypothetical protein
MNNLDTMKKRRPVSVGSYGTERPLFTFHYRSWSTGDEVATDRNTDFSKLYVSDFGCNTPLSNCAFILMLNDGC